MNGLNINPLRCCPHDGVQLADVKRSINVSAREAIDHNSGIMLFQVDAAGKTQVQIGEFNMRWIKM